MKVIGLTGGIGSGKSTVAQFLKELGAVVLHADEVAHKVFQPNSQGRDEVVAAFGRQILAPDGTVDRKKLGEIVFGNPEALSRLNRIVHPRTYEMIKNRLEEYRQQGVKVVLEVPLLMEAGWTPLVDEVWVTTASETTVLKRLEERRGMSPTESLARIHSQLPTEERVKHADVVINTDCGLDELKKKVETLWQKRQLDTSSPQLIE